MQTQGRQQPSPHSRRPLLTCCPLPQKLKWMEAHIPRRLTATGHGLAHRNQNPLTSNPKFEHQNTKKTKSPLAPLRSTCFSLAWRSSLRNYLWASQLSWQSAPFSQEASCIWSRTRRLALGRKGVAGRCGAGWWCWLLGARATAEVEGEWWRRDAQGKGER